MATLVRFLLTIRTRGPIGGGGGEDRRRGGWRVALCREGRQVRRARAASVALLMAVSTREGVEEDDLCS